MVLLLIRLYFHVVQPNSLYASNQVCMFYFLCSHLRIYFTITLFTFVKLPFNTHIYPPQHTLTATHLWVSGTTYQSSNAFDAVALLEGQSRYCRSMSGTPSTQVSLSSLYRPQNTSALGLCPAGQLQLNVLYFHSQVNVLGWQTSSGKWW